MTFVKCVGLTPLAFFVEYALAGMDNGLFVSKYQLELPKKEEMQRFIEEKYRETVDEYK